MSDPRPDSPVGAEIEPSPVTRHGPDGVAVFRRRGMPVPWRLGDTVRVDFEAGVISRGRRRLTFESLRVLEVTQGIFGASDGESWITFDTARHRDEQGNPLLERRGSLSPRFAAVLDGIQRRVLAARASAAPGDPALGADGALSTYDLRYELRIDPGLIGLGALGFGIFIGHEWWFSEGGELPLNDLVGGTGWFLAALVGFLIGYLLWRGMGSLRFDSSGVLQRRGFLERFQSWEEISGVRFQGLELELDGERGRVGCNLSALRGRGSPLVIRRGVRPVLTPLGARFLRWVLKQAPERPEIPVFGSPRLRLAARLWSAALVSINATMLFISSSSGLVPGNATRRLEWLGARTPDSFEEPWRFFTALFLHANLIHFGFNMLILVSLAPWLGRIFGWFRGTLVYLASGVLGNCIAQALSELSPEGPGISIGASTAILGVIGALLGAIYRRPYSVPLVVRARFRWAIPVVVLLTLASGLAIDRLDNAAHFGGFVAGFVLMWVIPPRRPVVAGG